MTALTELTTNAEIRATLGVSTTEIPDRLLELPLYGFVVDLYAEKIHDSVVARFLEIKAKTESERTVLEKKFYGTAKLFFPYAVAIYLTATLPMFSLKKLTDGKAEFDRFDDALAITLANLAAMFASISNRLGLALQAMDPTVVIPTYTAIVTSVAVGLAIDPVTANA